MAYGKRMSTHLESTWQDIPVQNPYLLGRGAMHDELEAKFFGDPTISALLDRYWLP